MNDTVTAFLADKIIARGERDAVARAIAPQLAEQDGKILVFEDHTGRITDLVYRETAVRAAGRPRLGVLAREVTLLPRHWDWLSTQPGGASAALRRLVDAQRGTQASDRERRDRGYRFMQAACGDLAGYEEALRALYAGDDHRLDMLVEEWPADLSSYLKSLLTSAPSVGRA